MSDITALNAYYGSSCIMKLTRFIAKKGEFLSCLGKELAGISRALSIKNNVKFSLKATEKDYCNRKPGTNIIYLNS